MRRLCCMTSLVTPLSVLMHGCGPHFPHRVHCISNPALRWAGVDLNNAQPTFARAGAPPAKLHMCTGSHRPNLLLSLQSPRPEPPEYHSRWCCQPGRDRLILQHSASPPAKASWTHHDSPAGRCRVQAKAGGGWQPDPHHLTRLKMARCPACNRLQVNSRHAPTATLLN